VSSGPDHYRRAERLLEELDAKMTKGEALPIGDMTVILKFAEVHTKLADVAAWVEAEELYEENAGWAEVLNLGDNDA
jgi:hypothetical protein